jgi:hypothetical protein
MTEFEILIKEYLNLNNKDYLLAVKKVEQI